MDELAGQPLGCSRTAGSGVPAPPSSGSGPDLLTRSVAIPRTSLARPGGSLPLVTTLSVGPHWGTGCQVGCAQGSERMGSPGCHCLSWHGLRTPVIVYGRAAPAHLLGTPVGWTGQERQETAAPVTGSAGGWLPWDWHRQAYKRQDDSGSFSGLEHRTTCLPWGRCGERRSVMRWARGRCVCVMCGRE